VFVQTIIPSQLLPLLSDWILLRPADSNCLIRSVQSSTASIAVLGALHTAAPADYGLPEGEHVITWDNRDIGLKRDVIEQMCCLHRVMKIGNVFIT
jgi:hypothetical protein